MDKKKVIRKYIGRGLNYLLNVVNKEGLRVFGMSKADIKAKEKKIKDDIRHEQKDKRRQEREDKKKKSI